MRTHKYYIYNPGYRTTCLYIIAKLLITLTDTGVDYSGSEKTKCIGLPGPSLCYKSSTILLLL